MIPLTLPGTIPGLLRRGSPVRASNDPERLGVVVGTGSSLGTLVFWHWSETTSWTLETPVDLDLSDPTGRAHAAWWLWRQDINAVELAIATVLGPNTDYAGWLDEVSSGADDSDDDIAALRLVCLHVAGVSA